MAMPTRVFTHNQNTWASKREIARSNDIWFSPPKGAYFNLPNVRGVRTPGTDQMTALLAPTPTPGSSNPRTFSGRKRFDARKRARTIFG